MNSPILFGAIAVTLILIALLAVILIRQNKAGTLHRKNKAAKNAMARGIAIGEGLKKKEEKKMGLEPNRDSSPAAMKQMKIIALLVLLVGAFFVNLGIFL